jgi:hypothetical protein
MTASGRNQDTGENHLPTVSHWQTYNVVSSTHRHEQYSNSKRFSDFQQKKIYFENKFINKFNGVKITNVIFKYYKCGHRNVLS